LPRSNQIYGDWLTTSAKDTSTGIHVVAKSWAVPIESCASAIPTWTGKHRIGLKDHILNYRRWC